MELLQKTSGQQTFSCPPTTKLEAAKEIQGFEVRHDLTVVFRDISNAGPILDALVDAGANQVSGPRFSWQAGEQATAVARAAAIREANERAQFYAKALGLRVKRVVSMRDGGGYASGDAIVVTGSRVATQISPGEDRVRVSIQADYELTPRANVSFPPIADVSNSVSLGP